MSVLLSLAAGIFYILGLNPSVLIEAAHNNGVSPTLLEGICRYESDNGRVKVHHNRNGSWDVGYCQNHRAKSDKPPKVPSNNASVREAARELAYWKKQHQRYCVDYLRERGSCGPMKRCRKNHAWYGHYNWGFRVLSNNYDRKVHCFISKGYKRCKESEWRKVRF